MQEDSNYENRLKGRIAEGLIEALFLGSGIEIRRTGLEWLKPLFPHIDEETQRQINWRIGKIPDFCIMQPGGDNAVVAEYIEVKFRANGILEEKEVVALKKNNPWKPSLILVQLVSPRHKPGSRHKDDKARIRVSRHPYKEDSPGMLYNVPIYTIDDWPLKRELCGWADGALDKLYSLWLRKL